MSECVCVCACVTIQLTSFPFRFFFRATLHLLPSIGSRLICQMYLQIKV